MPLNGGFKYQSMYNIFIWENCELFTVVKSLAKEIKKKLKSHTFCNNNVQGTLFHVASSINKYVSNCGRSNHKELSWCTSSWLKEDHARVVSGSWLSPRDYSSTNVNKVNGGANIITARDDWQDIINCKDKIQYSNMDLQQGLNYS